MEGIVTVTVSADAINSPSKMQLDEKMAALGLQKTLPATEGGVLHLPDGTYAQVIELEEAMDQLKTYYRSIVKVLRALDLHCAYFVNVATDPCFACGQL